MAGGASILEDDSTLSMLDQKLFKLETFFALISGLAVLGLVGLAVVSVGGRNIANSPLRGYVDLIEISMPIIAFLGISYTQRPGGHIRMDMIVGRLNGRLLWGAELITALVTLVLMLLLVWGTFSHFDRSFGFDRPLWSNDSTMDLALPLWPAKLLIPTAFSILCLRMLLQIWGYGRALVLGLSEPVAVPLVLSAKEQALDEAAHVSNANEGGTS
ncbi:MAG: TRAP transporter small permease [Rhodobacteraceae bacterium]|nr:TRAP transporter small permease [Paracoccaceae bacterium]